jgi:hypothetical protein
MFPRWLLSNKDAPESDNKTCKAKMFLRWLLSNKDAPESENKTCKAKIPSWKHFSFTCFVV